MTPIADRWLVKLSKEFAGRLAVIPADKTLCAVVLLRTKERRGASQRQTSTQRRAAIDALRKTGRPVLVDMDQILAQCGGRRLDDDVTALGTVAVETTPTGIKSLANLKDVRTVLEDQNVAFLR